MTEQGSNGGGGRRKFDDPLLDEIANVAAGRATFRVLRQLKQWAIMALAAACALYAYSKNITPH